MRKKRIIIWGGNAKSFDIEYINSHASVNAFFLTKYLKQYFEVINITDIDKPELILDYENIHAVIATSQFGFTNRVINKGKEDLFNKIRNHVSGKLCSIADNNNVGKYYEDVLFCVRPVNEKKLIQSRALRHNHNLEAVRSGWCAEPSVFYPEDLENEEFNVFIDHAPYSKASLNYISKFHWALNKVVKKHSNINFNIYHQNNNGLIMWDFKSDSNLSKVYDRAIKVPYLDIAEVFRKIHIFCFTHKESAGLSGIEAASAGAKLYIPQDIMGSAFIKEDLLKDAISYKKLKPFGFCIYNQFMKDIKTGIDRKANHENVLNSNNTWEAAAKVIFNCIN